MSLFERLGESWIRRRFFRQQPHQLRQRRHHHRVRRVGSRTDAVFRRSNLSLTSRFLWECLNGPTVNPFPVLATSNRTGGIPASGSPIDFT